MHDINHLVEDVLGNYVQVMYDGKLAWTKLKIGTVKVALAFIYSNDMIAVD